MALDDLSPENGDNNGSSGGSRRYVQIQDHEFIQYLEDRSEGWYIANTPVRELVFQSDELKPGDDRIAARIFSTLDERTGKARKKGADAIRLVAWHLPTDRPIGGRRKTLRIETWRSNLGPKIDSLFDEFEEYSRVCENCGSWMVVREGRYGKFYGCTSYPDCDNTKQYDG